MNNLQEKTKVQTKSTPTIPVKASYGTAIKACKCESEFQDKEYGFKLRVHNKMIKAGKLQGYRCTVCGNVIRM